ncbi:hypothetical protein P170DRAFT_473988 [Aspergillus steynii IBT 23096]|uniref:Uncharacterized protein n=1 Tax=Aspergillus steynii IBT 23096 TaxID=1392250 RepID=A0A2I2GC26_9EURO|nr:uncharacterized protein P170DRAFT_473988 [Aspergillus steynii IBT 23096]PLB50432.1 hypothetical protein P170DRAFT_473988 [Aspergillus steynii IBT 23096]
MRFSGQSLSMLCLLVTGTLAAFPGINDENYGIGKPHGIDKGNSICLGQCTPNPALLTCAKPVFKKDRGCFVCCFSDDDLDGFDKQIPEDPVGDGVLPLPFNA